MNATTCTLYTVATATTGGSIGTVASSLVPGAPLVEAASWVPDGVFTYRS